MFLAVNVAPTFPEIFLNKSWHALHLVHCGRAMWLRTADCFVRSFVRSFARAPFWPTGQILSSSKHDRWITLSLSSPCALLVLHSLSSSCPVNLWGSPLYHLFITSENTIFIFSERFLKKEVICWSAPVFPLFDAGLIIKQSVLFIAFFPILCYR